ncbi:MAG: CAP domain-containing protein [Mucilaginibacter sp.]|uniref:CAP domain-containing protein n=1 Tax=Mucilaginibacter sp. TaxID=1882438 RepID=UPI0031A33098
MRKLIATIIVTLTVLITFNRVYAQSGRQFKADFLNRINLTRQRGCNCGARYMPPAPPISWNNDLEDAAAGHAKDMAKRNYFNHMSKDGRSMGDRILRAGYTYKDFKSYVIGENIAAGQESIDEVMDGWFKSEGHCLNLMNPDFKEVGVAMYKNYWVQDFGGRESFSAEQQKLIKSGKYRLIQKKIAGHD